MNSSPPSPTPSAEYLDQFARAISKVAIDGSSDIIGIISALWHLFIAGGVSSLTFWGIVITFVSAWLGIRNSRDTAKKKATIDLILDEQTNEYIQRNREIFILLRRGNIKLDFLMRSNFKRNKVIYSQDGKRIRSFEAKEAIKACLNRYEMMAVGIDEDILCEDTYKEWLYHTVIADWKAVENFVTQLRNDTGNESFYEHFERMAIRFNPKSSTLKKTWREKIGIRKKH